MSARRRAVARCGRRHAQLIQVPATVPFWDRFWIYTSCAVVNDLRVCELVARHHLDHIVVVTCGNVLPLLLGVKWSHTTKSRLIRAPSLYCESMFDRSE